MKVDGSQTQVLLRAVQMHPFRNEVLHVDFQRIDATRKIHMKVPLHFVNAAESPAVKAQGAVVSHVMTEIDVACLPAYLPEFIEVDLSGLDTSQPLHVSGVKLPPGVAIVTHRSGDPVVATAVVPKAAVEAEAVEGAEGEAATAATAAPAAPAAETKPADAKAETAKKDEKKK
jgi:large subunit ribosomal protein L25